MNIHTPTDMWIARIHNQTGYGPRDVNLGYFKNEKDAARAYDVEAKKRGYECNFDDAEGADEGADEGLNEGADDEPNVSPLVPQVPSVPKKAPAARASLAEAEADGAGQTLPMLNLHTDSGVSSSS